MPTTLYEAFCNEIDDRYSILSDAARENLKRMLRRIEDDAFTRGYYPKKRQAAAQSKNIETIDVNLIPGWDDNNDLPDGVKGAAG